MLQFGFVFYHDRTRHSFSKYFLMHIKKICKCIIHCIWKGLTLILKIVLHTIQELTLLGLEITKMNPIAITVTFHTVNKILYITQGITLQINFFLFSFVQRFNFQEQFHPVQHASFCHLYLLTVSRASYIQ